MRVEASPNYGTGQQTAPRSQNRIHEDSASEDYETYMTAVLRQALARPEGRLPSSIKAKISGDRN